MSDLLFDKLTLALHLAHVCAKLSGLLAQLSAIILDVNEAIGHVPEQGLVAFSRFVGGFG